MSLVVTTLIYIVINPLTMAGDWCLDVLEDQRGDLPRNSIFLDCHEAAKEDNVPYSGIAMTLPVFSASLDIICLAIYSGIKFARFQSRKKETYTMYRDLIFAVLVVGCFLDIVVSLIFFEK